MDPHTIESEIPIDTTTDEAKRQHVAFLAHSFCERINHRLTLFVAKEIITAESAVGIFLGDSERAAYMAACRHLGRQFEITE